MTHHIKASGDTTSFEQLANSLCFLARQVNPDEKFIQFMLDLLSQWGSVTCVPALRCCEVPCDLDLEMMDIVGRLRMSLEAVCSLDIHMVRLLGSIVMVPWPGHATSFLEWVATIGSKQVSVMVPLRPATSASRKQASKVRQQCREPAVSGEERSVAWQAGSYDAGIRLDCAPDEGRGHLQVAVRPCVGGCLADFGVEIVETNGR
jgi:hypothetical protein